MKKQVTFPIAIPLPFLPSVFASAQLRRSEEQKAKDGSTQHSALSTQHFK